MSKYAKGEKAVCPHCGTAVQFAIGGIYNLSGGLIPIGSPITRIEWTCCPSCDEFIVTLEIGEHSSIPPAHEWRTRDELVLWPLKSQRPAVPTDVPEHIKSDYEEAALVLALSAKASAALSRRCLQTVLVEVGGANPKSNLARQIEEVRPQLPSAIGDALDYVRVVGNFAAHTQKSINTGAIIDVEQGEAEWNLDVLDMLFDHFYVKPAEIERRKRKLSEKLVDVGKQPMK